MMIIAVVVLALAVLAVVLRVYRLECGRIDDVACVLTLGLGGQYVAQRLEQHEKRLKALERYVHVPVQTDERARGN